MDHFECKSCGNTLNKKQSHCPYCGSHNPNYAKEVTYKTFSSYNSNDNYNSNSYNNTQKSSYSSSSDDDGINICILIILIIVFWPGAIIYAIIKSNK